ncbi:hypothetical protein I302_106175 [Kwoniella bestiolae CBS 10118]|uniref:GATA-type domain-containing protein n=1 Tax=Kwoniella bestiolae CBS 10118 TaxID=1296100 RepID=A0A1B9G3B3_9TREE|nr:hypothetical protein I302_05298 [Kwoniella bestiolae CBS 10118]OCF25478.1 hypothetical protein I302_05298 [Kwoniella bestiolae CBS 10118]
MSSSSLAPNKIHSLPVRVSYYLPSTSQTFTTLFSTPQQVYVHPNTAAASTQNGQEEAWGSIYLKTVVLGVLMASPELHPAYPSTPDLSLYVLDPRETYLRRSRAGSSSFISHPRSQHSSSPSSDALSSPNLSYGNPQPPQTHEVWTGKGLVSWALDEPGQGKNLITGRLVRSAEFSNIAKQQEMNPLEALMMADMNGMSTQEEWGIEISVGLKSGIGGFAGSQPRLSGSMSMDARPDAMRRSSTSSSTETNVSTIVNHFQRPLHPLPKRHEQPRRPQLPTPSSSSSAHPHQELGTTRVVSGNKHTPSRPTDVKAGKPSGSGSAGKKRKGRTSTSTSTTSLPTRNSLGTIDPNSDPLKRRSTLPHPQIKRSPAPSSVTAEPFPTDIPAGLFAKPESLTREQAQRLLASPAFLSMLEKLTGAPIDAAAAAKRAREDEDEPSNKKSKVSHGHGHSRKGSTDSPGEPSHNAFVCWNCGRTKSAVWRTKVMEDGKSVRVCNACGLYWNKMGSMRPPTLWGDVDDDPKDRPRKDKKGPSGPSSARQSSQAPTSEPDIPAVRIDKPATRSNSDHGFKRTLSSVVEEDAKRIAASHHHTHLRKPMPKSNLHHTTKPVPMSSPPRGSTSATKSLRNAKWNDQVAASSPIRWDNHNDQVGKSDNFHTDPTESPATTLRKAYNQGQVQSQDNGNKNTQTLDMPLSDDGPGISLQPAEQKPSINWGTDLSAFFDVEGFSMPPHQPHNTGVEIQRSISDEGKQMRKPHSLSSSTGTEEDDVLSQLFNRTSSVGISSSPSIHPFDFSALPPSSPPIGSSDSLPHSALLLSSPDNSPLTNNDFSPMDNKHSNTPGKSRLRHSISANQINHQPQQQVMDGTGGLDFEDIQRMLNNIGNHNQSHNQAGSKVPSPGQENGGYDMLQEIFGKLHDTQHQHQGTSSSVGQTDEIVGGFHGQGHANANGEDIFAMLEGGAFA